MSGPGSRGSTFAELYLLHLDVERIANALRDRSRRGWRPLPRHIKTLYEISARLKVLDEFPKTVFPDQPYSPPPATQY